MTDTPVPPASGEPPRVESRSGEASAGDRGAVSLGDEAAAGARRARNQRIGNHLLIHGSRIGAIIPVIALVGMFATLLIEAIPAIKFDGWGFFTSSVWNPGNPYSVPSHAGGVYHLAGAHFGAWPLILGTLESSAIALIIGLPVAVGAAVMLVERLPARPAGVLGLCLEVLAGIPSVVIGLWGILTFGPWLAQHIYPALTHMPNVPVLNFFRGTPAHNGEGLLTGGLVLAVMIIPIIAATTRDLLMQVPGTTKEGAEALGMTHSEAFFAVQARWVRGGVIGAAVLGLGRALGETIAIALVSGSIQEVAPNIFAGMTTIAAAIVQQLGSLEGDPTGLGVRVVAELALVLLGITLIVNALARVIVRRAARGAALPVGAGF